MVVDDSGRGRGRDLGEEATASKLLLNVRELSLQANVLAAQFDDLFLKFRKECLSLTFVVNLASLEYYTRAKRE